MKKFIFYIILFIHISLFSKETRIISLAPNLTEIVYALGLGGNLVGDTNQCDYPEQAKNIYKVGDYINPNIERILITKPNYVLATLGNPRSLVNKLKLQGINVIEAEDPKNAKELKILIEKVANKLGVSAQGKEISNHISQAIEELEQHKVKNKRFLFILQYDPIYSISNNTWIGNLFALAGYDNVVGASKISYPIISTEYLIKNKPDMVFVGNNPHISQEENNKIQRFKLEQIFGMNEAKSIRIIYLPKDILVRPGPRIIDGIHFIESL